MKDLFKSIAHVFSFSFPTERERDERYLAGATDIYELEYRMRQIDAPRHQPAFGPYALFIR